jgi:hypothetical protein
MVNQVITIQNASASIIYIKNIPHEIPIPWQYPTIGLYKAIAFRTEYRLIWPVCDASVYAIMCLCAFILCIQTWTEVSLIIIFTISTVCLRKRHNSSPRLRKYALYILCKERRESRLIIELFYITNTYTIKTHQVVKAFKHDVFRICSSNIFPQLHLWKE